MREMFVPAEGRDSSAVTAWIITVYTVYRISAMQDVPLIRFSTEVTIPNLELDDFSTVSKSTRLTIACESV